MFCLSKKIIKTSLLMSLIVLSFLPASYAEQNAEYVKRFNLVIEQVKEVKKTDLVLASSKLKSLTNHLHFVSVDRSLLYFKLLAEVLVKQHKYNEAKESANKGLEASKKLSSPSIITSELLYLKGSANKGLEDLKQASNEFKKGLEVAESLFDKENIALGLTHLSTIAYLSDDIERSLILLNDAYNIAGQTDNEEVKGTVNYELGKVYAYLEQDEQSMAYYKQSYIYFKNVGLLLAAQNSLNNIALTHIRNENYQEGINVFNTIIAESTNDTSNDSFFSVYAGLASAHLKKSNSDPEAAYQNLLIAKDFLDPNDNLDHKLQFHIDKANVLTELGRYDYALISIHEVEALFQKTKKISLAKKRSYIDIIDLKAKVYYQQEEYEKAYHAKKRVASLTEKLYANEDDRSITQVRLKLEAEQADKERKVLRNQRKLYEASLREANVQNDAQKTYMLVSALVALCFAWILVKLVQSQHKLKLASNTDALTRVSNRRNLMVQAKEAFKLSKAKAIPLSILLIDVDFFKKVNDSLGHKVGDEVLQVVAALGEGMMRKSDLFGRFGGEEFMVCLPKTNVKTAIDIGERIRTKISQHEWDITHLEKVTISIGVASMDGDADLLALIKRADEQLYHAKASGRNKVCG